MTFKDELNKTVVSVRETVKRKASVAFSNALKSAMETAASQGKTSGETSIDSEIEYDDETNYVEIYEKLEEILIIEGLIKDKSNDKLNVYKWLLEDVQKTDVFKDIFFNIDDNNDYWLKFHWCLDD